MLQLVDCPEVDGDEVEIAAIGGISHSHIFDLFHGVSMEERAQKFIASLFRCVGIKFFVSENFFMLEGNPNCGGASPKWALRFDMMKGVIRERGRLIVQILPKNAALSIPGWHRNKHPVLSFIDAVYLCRRWSKRLDQEAFSDVLGGSEDQLETHIHAMLIAGLSVLSIASSHQLVDKLITAILGGNLDPIEDSVSNTTAADWQVLNQIKCGCSSKSVHRPLSAVAAAKAVGFDIWRDRQMETVTRVWDLERDTLIRDIDVSKVIFITHRWSKSEMEYADVTERKWKTTKSISMMSEKLRRIRDALRIHTRYVWIDAICIDKSNLSELDEAIRSMYKWYASCRAVVLECGTPLAVWRKRGWCLQEGAAAGVLCGISKEGKLVSIHQLAIEQQQELCTLDLHLYYRAGNAIEILARMDARKTTRKEDMAYALTGILSIHLVLAYGEGFKSRERLLHELAIQKGDLSFLSFPTTRKTAGTHLPAITDIKFSIAKCVQASTPATVSHLGLSIEVQLISGDAAKKLLESLSRWKSLNFVQGKYIGLDGLIKKARNLEFQATASLEFAIIHNIRSIMLVDIYGKDRQTGGGRPLKFCSPIQCCQIEENEFKRLFIHEDVDLERIWLGDKSVSTDAIP
jgi:Heterokaryon incompatibility protein (HET)